MFFRKKQKNSIKELSISFGNKYHKVINLNENTLSHYNRIGSAIGSTPFPKEYFETKTIKLTSDQLKILLEEVQKIPFTEWKSDKDIEKRCPGANYQSFSCEYINGRKLNFSTRFTPPESFCDMFFILSEHCKFSENELIEIGFIKTTLTFGR